MKRAFTLIDILVTLAIVAVLIAILLPSLRHARDAARLVKCTSNLSQLRTSMMIYVDAYNTTPIWNEYPEDDERLTIEPASAVWLCPSDPDKGVNRRGGLTSYDASGIRNMRYHSMKGHGFDSTAMLPNTIAVAWDYQKVHAGLRNRVFVDGSIRRVP